ncbi:DUF3426 domain-containing protein [Marinobacter mobilis]|uniref:MJ0042 family finger-like domain-containing protein n=1 Tax=Marinobacter mobilis TaxID=488533 RepID=A0A1H2QIF6_9GAMM|nr:DUF3426 domain-containing protein [Marinobacter mobilis]SDW06189.1 MJ0042 family finger-like domain-containing protein [Marinobacter mobilis]
MSESSLLTRCPKCKTQFRVTAEQLSVANGKVRCGSCMSIFNALEHRTTSTASQPAPAPSAPQPPTFTSEPAAEEDFVFADNPEEDASERGYKGSDSTFSHDELSESFLAMEEGSFTGFAAEDEDDLASQNQDESWAEAILEDDHSEPAVEPRQESNRAQPETRPKPEPEPESEPELALREPIAPATPEPKPSIEAKPEPKREPETQSRPQARDEVTALSLEASPSDRQTTTFSTDTPAAATEKGTSKPEPFHNLAREPVSVSGKTSSGWLKRTFWTLLVLGLVGALGAQVGYFQFDRLSAVPELRPYYEMACEYAGCELAPLVDIDSIQSRKLVVRTDPENRNALIVDAEIVNRAPFEQPFPAIALTFSNLNGDVVAQSVFPPQRYLAGDGDQLAAMPKEVPVRIAIRIRDPGRDAVNYNIAFRPYTP